MGAMVIKQLITLNPYRSDVYEYLIKEEGDFKQRNRKVSGIFRLWFKAI